jgi:hypothetical protein
MLLPATASAQFDTSTVLGAVRDSSGGVIPGATVTLTNIATGITANVVSSADGGYQFLNVRVGTYTVRAELQGFSVAEAKDVAVVVNARQRVDLTLTVGNIGETVDRQPAAERPRLRGPCAAQSGRPPLRDRGFARRLVQRQRAAQRRQQLHVGRSRQQFVRDQQPGLLEPGSAGVARRSGTVQGPDQ